MKQKIVIKMCMKDQKSRSKAMQIAFRVLGVEKAALEGSGKDRIEVTGDGIDSVALVILLRKQFGTAELLSVSPMDEKKAQPPKAESGNPQREIQYLQHEIPYWPHVHAGGCVVYPPHFYYDQIPYHRNSSCPFM